MGLEVGSRASSTALPARAGNDIVPYHNELIHEGLYKTERKRVNLPVLEGQRPRAPL